MQIEAEYKGLTLVAPNFVNLSIDGVFASPEVESSDLKFSNRDGVLPGRDYVRGRSLSISGTIVAFNETDFATQIEYFRDAFVVGIPDERELSLTMPGLAGGQTVAILCKPRAYGGAIDVDYDNMSAGFKVDLYATDPNFYTPISAYHSQALSTTTTPGGHGFPLAFPHGFGSGAGTLTIIENAGNVSVWPKFTIFGPLINVHLISQTEAAEVSLEIELSSTDQLDIDFKAKTIVLSGGASRFDTLRDSEWWQLAPGSNTVQFSVDSSTGTPSANILWKDGYQ